MKKYKSAILSANPAQIDYVYTPAQIQEIASITDFLPGIYRQEDVESGKLADVEVLFSTWGMVKLDDALLDRMPALKAVFYAAGATDYFARPLFARGIRVFSAWRANAIPVAEFCVAQIILGLKGYFRASRSRDTARFWDR